MAYITDEDGGAGEDDAIKRIAKQAIDDGDCDLAMDCVKALEGRPIARVRVLKYIEELGVGE